MRSTQCAMACGGDAATIALNHAEAWGGCRAGSGAVGVSYSTFSSAGGTAKARWARSLCWPCLQCSAQSVDDTSPVLGATWQSGWASASAAVLLLAAACPMAIAGVAAPLGHA